MLRRQGLTVTIVAANAPIQKPTETASPKFRQILDSIGATSALAACEPCFGICSSWSRNALAFESSIANPFGHGWFIHRERFDLLLRELTLGAGADWVSGRAQSVVFGPGDVSVLTESAKIHARWVIFATGSPTWPARITGQRILALDSLVAYWAHLPARFEPRVILVEPSNNGWWYACPGNGCGAVVCFITDVPISRAMQLSFPSNWIALFQ